jgi:hypothetical protein
MATAIASKSATIAITTLRLSLVFVFSIFLPFVWVVYFIGGACSAIVFCAFAQNAFLSGGFAAAHTRRVCDPPPERSFANAQDDKGASLRMTKERSLGCATPPDGAYGA